VRDTVDGINEAAFERAMLGPKPKKCPKGFRYGKGKGRLVDPCTVSLVRPGRCIWCDRAM
jgi:hypothetical protein